MSIPEPMDELRYSQGSSVLVKPHDSTLAIISLVTGVLSWLILPLLGSLAAVITGHLANKEINESNGMVTGKGFATAGLILGYIQLGFILLGFVLVIILLLTMPQISEIINNISSSL